MTFSGTLCLQNDDKMRERERELMDFLPFKSSITEDVFRERVIEREEREREHNGKGAFVSISWNEPDQRVLW